jgi:thioredoxin reductase
VERKTGVRINYRERVETIEREVHGFSIKTTRGTYRSRCVLLAIGRRGTPRKLGVQGEQLPKVAYRPVDPEQYAGQRVLVVGGGDSALEAACSIAEVPGTVVTLSYRSAAFTRAKAKNRDRVQSLADAGRLQVVLPSNVAAISDDSVELVREGRTLSLDNDSVIINAGGILPGQFLRSIGIDVETKYGTT